MQKNVYDHSRSRVKVGEHRFLINGKVTSLYSGAVHYWRLDRDKWDDILEKVKGMGFTTITTYIPWEVHEVSKGEFDFGKVKPSNDIDGFLALCEKKGLKAIVRPGPQINSELTWFGYPQRILEDPEMQARSAQNSKAVLTQVPRPIPALSYASKKFFDETAVWYDAICAILAKHAYPKGCIVAAQVDNEMAYFFHVNPYACDYSPSSIQGYQAFLREKYSTIETVNETYGSNHQSFAQIDPPRRFEGKKKEDIPYYTDWIEYRERYLIDSLTRLAQMMKDRGLHAIPIFHNYPHPLGPGGSASGFTTPFNLPALEEKLDFVGFDFYSRKELYDHVKMIVSYVVGSSRYPFIPEFVAGVWPWYLRPGGLYDEEFVTKAALMHGIKGSSRYMIVERNRWLASPVMRDGRIREDRYRMHQKVNEMMVKHRFIDLQRQADVVLLANREYDRLEAASVLVSFPGDFLEPLLSFSEYPNFMTVSESTFGFDQPIQLAKTDWFATCYKTLTRLGYCFLLGDSGHNLEAFMKRKVLMLSAFEYMSASLQGKLVKFAESGGRVVLGPKLPRLDEQTREEEMLLQSLQAADRSPISVDGIAVGNLYRLGEGSVVHLRTLERPAPTRILEAVLKDLKLVHAEKNDERLDVAIHKLPDESGRTIVFVANPTAELIRVQIGLGIELESVDDIWEEKTVTVRGHSFADELPAYTIKIYVCTV